MLSKEQKIEAIRQYAEDLTELAIAYRKAASIAEKLPDKTLEAMYLTAMETNKLHNDLAIAAEAK